MLVAVDVDYRDTGAMAAAVWFNNWESANSVHESTAWITPVEEYQPGEFYRRELPCLLKVLQGGPTPKVVIVDGYVWLDAGRPGLGAKLHEALKSIPVVGVAKTKFLSATGAVEVLRGESQSPLFVSAAGMLAEEAAEQVRTMAGEYRVPTLLKQVDHLARFTRSPEVSE